MRFVRLRRTTWQLGRESSETSAKGGRLFETRDSDGLLFARSVSTLRREFIPFLSCRRERDAGKPNQTVQRIGASRFAQGQIERQ